MEEYSIGLKIGIVHDPPKKVMEGHIDSKKNIRIWAILAIYRKHNKTFFYEILCFGVLEPHPCHG